MVIGNRTLRLELTTGVSGAACAHGLRVEGVNLDEVAGCQLLKPGPVPPPLCFARFHQSPFSLNSIPAEPRTGMDAAERWQGFV